MENHLWNHFRILLQMFWSPSTAFLNLPKRAPFLFPLSIVILVSIPMSWTLLPTMMTVANRTLSTGVQTEQHLEMLERIHTLQEVGIALSPFAVLLKWAFIAALLFLLAQLFDGKTSYRQTYSLVAFASIVPLLESMAVFVILILKNPETIQGVQDLQPPLGINLFIRDISPAWFAFLGAFNFFQIWYLLILVWGMSALNRFSFRKAALIVLPVWFFLVGIQVFFVAMGRGQN
jgi:hypothetical protein